MCSIHNTNFASRRTHQLVNFLSDLICDWNWRCNCI